MQFPTCFATRLAAVLLCLVYSATTGVAADQTFEQQSLFKAEQGGYKCYRIPALLTTDKGTVLALAEARKNSCSDHGDIDLVLRRSLDGGRTWSENLLIADDDEHTMGNPCLVLDRSSGTIWLTFCRDNRRILVTKSTDDGKTWSKPLDITRTAMNPAWHWVGTGPGHGIQLSNGRLLIPCWAALAKRLGEIQLSFVFSSDDHGATWKLGGSLEANTSDECEVVELQDGSLYLNGRRRQGKKQRAYSFSTDAGQTWSPVKYNRRLPEPSCQGSVVRLTDSRHFHKGRVLLATPANPSARTALTVRISYDECRSWPVAKVINAGTSAYSDLTVTTDRQILCLYESDDYSNIVLARFNIEWLTDSQDRLRLR